MVEAVLGVDLERYGSLISKTPVDNLTIRFDWDHVGAAITFNAEVSIGHKGIAIDTFGKRFAEDGPGPVRITGLSCPKDDTEAGYYHQLTAPLSTYYGADESITDGAVRVVFKITGQPDKAGYLWNAFKITPAPPVGYSLTWEAWPIGAGGLVKSPDKDLYNEGEVVTLTAVPMPGTDYKFDRWEGTNNNYINPTTVTMTSDKHVVVRFSKVAPPPVEYTLTTAASPWNAGYVVGGGVYDTGARVTIYAESYAGYAFDHWGGDASGTWSPTTITMDRDKHVIAYFKAVAPPPEEYSLSVDVSPGVGYVTVVPSQFTYHKGDVVTLTAYLDSWAMSSYVFDHWVVNGTARAGNPISITMNQNTVVTAHFIYVGAF